MKNTLSPDSVGDPHFSVMQRVIDGTLKITSIREFEEILEFYPSDPLLFRKYGDLLLEKNHRQKARSTYEKAAELFIEQGMNLQAIVAKILQWSLSKPNHDQGRRFHALLRDKGARYTPLQRFWAHMSYAELVAVMLRLVRVRLPSGTKVIERGEPSQEVLFVVSGALSETPPSDCEDEATESGYDTEPSMLGPNDIFGEVFPLDRPTIANSEIRTLTDVELVKIDKSVLRKISKTYPNIKKSLHELYRSGYRHNCDRTWQTVRRSLRFGIPTKAEMTCYSAKSTESSIYLDGIAVDLSLGGICVDVQTDVDASIQSSLKGMLVQLHLDLLNDVADIDVTGKVVWHRRQKSNTRESLFIGIRFDSLSRADRDLLSEYCSGNVGEQNLLWSLWDTMVRTDNT